MTSLTFYGGVKEIGGNKALLKKLKLKPSEVLMVGDNPERDIKGAEKVGIKAVMVEKGNLTWF